MAITFIVCRTQYSSSAAVYTQYKTTRGTQPSLLSGYRFLEFWKPLKTFLQVNVQTRIIPTLEDLLLESLVVGRMSTLLISHNSYFCILFFLFNKILKKMLVRVIIILSHKFYDHLIQLYIDMHLSKHQIQVLKDVLLLNLRNLCSLFN